MKAFCLHNRRPMRIFGTWPKENFLAHVSATFLSQQHSGKTSENAHSETLSCLRALSFHCHGSPVHAGLLRAEKHSITIFIFRLPRTILLAKFCVLWSLVFFFTIFTWYFKTPCEHHYYSRHNSTRYWSIGGHPKRYEWLCTRQSWY